MLHKLKFGHEISGFWILRIAHLSFILWLRDLQITPTSHQRVTESGLTSLFLTPSVARPADLQPSMEAAAGYTTPEWKQILFTFNLLFPPLWNLERAKSCNTCIKNKCSRNGPTGHNAVRGFCGLAKKACGEKQSIRPIFQHVLLNNNNPQSDLDLFQRK